MYKNTHSDSFTLSLVIFPALVTLVIMLVNGNIGAGLGVAGTFSLIRFRSAQASAKELTCIFLDVAAGLACGMGYVMIAALFTVIVLAVSFLLTTMGFGRGDEKIRSLKVTIPENLDYDGLFEDIFEKYTRHHDLENVKTASLGSLYKLEYTVEMKDNAAQKQMIDEIRVRNGNLEVSLGKAVLRKGEL